MGTIGTTLLIVVIADTVVKIARWNNFSLTASNFDQGGGDPATGAVGCKGRAQGACSSQPLV